MAQWTNRYNLPRPLVLLITTDIYNKKRDEQLQAYCKAEGLDPRKVTHFSASDLIRPPRMRVLVKRYWHKVIKDVSSEVYRLLGQAIHNMLRDAAILGNLDKEGYRAEERMFVHYHVDGTTVVISGEPDIVSPEGRIEDYKVCAVWSWMKEAKKEWKQQLNIYAHLRSLKGLVTSMLAICYILRDWSLNETMQEGYPQSAAQMEDLELWTFDRQREFIMERIRLHLQAEQQLDDELEECTDEEMWAKPDAWAVIREGASRAVKVFTSTVALEKLRTVDPSADEEDAKAEALREATADSEDRNRRLKKSEKPYVVQHRAGERTRCLRFCDARPFCNQAQEYASAAFRTHADRQPAEEIL